MVDMNPAGLYLMNMASGTSRNPLAWQMPMRMVHFDHWNAMFMANAFIADAQQSGPRGGDKLYSTNWGMASFSHRLGARGVFGTDLMLSLEPATVTDRRYPLLFQTGETAYGQPLADAQHPHNFIMGLGFHYAYEFARDTLIHLYAAPVGDPALGPVAYPHRASAMELPQATLSHHWQDSTHIADDVVTVGLSHNQFGIEASGFHGREPGENRWIVQAGAIDSWSARISYAPSTQWAAQFSGGRIRQPEGPDAGDQIRLTASLAYTKSIGLRDWSTTAIWGRNHDTQSQRNLNSYLIESVFPLGDANLITGRAELVDKDELFSAQPTLEAQLPGSYRVGGYTIGYTREIPFLAGFDTGLGFNVTTYSLPAAIKPYYGDHPAAATVFLRLRLRSAMK